MNPVLPDDAVELGQTARRAFTKLGGVDAARRAEADPPSRHEIGGLLRELGIDDLDPRADADTAAAAAVLCAEAGRVALPYPVAGVVLRGGTGGDGPGRPVAVVPGRRLRVDHGDLFDEWLVCGTDGSAVVARPRGSRLATRLGPFVTDLAVGPGNPDGRSTGTGEDRDPPAGHDPAAPSAPPPPSPSPSPSASPTAPAASPRQAAWWLTLSSWTILGGLGRAVELATAHTQERIQFGKPLTAFQTVRFQLADAAIAVAGLRELALFTLWRLDVAPDQAWPDVLALRSHALDVARAVLRASQQLHGASGLCDELDICVLVRHLQPALRLPAGAEETARQLATAIAGHGFDGLFPHGTPAGRVA